MHASKPLTLRPARSADAHAVTAILRDTFESTWRPNITFSAAQAFRDEDRPAAYFAARGHEFLVCESAEGVMGFVDWQGDFVNALHVRGVQARSGVGTCLMDKAEAEIRKSGFLAARLETDTFNTVSQQFYAKRGYKEAGRYPDTEWSSDLVTILLVKPFQ
ncbi:MAG: GNAT family N-acetyltransferase [Alphaproteobacteria bacterium]|nr:GNAT family N-acetyltransferase [Alphaproteobacteria bacterium]